MKRILVIGYGNPDREDDGVAWHILNLLAKHYGIPAPDNYLEGFLPNGRKVDLFSALQLTPEMAETISEYDGVCFVDAHTGAVPNDVNVTRLVPGIPKVAFYTPHDTRNLPEYYRNIIFEKTKCITRLSSRLFVSIFT